MDHSQAPLYDKLVSHSRGGPVSFHVPGHKSGAGLDSTARDFYQQILSIDLTEISGLDDLHSPTGIIDQAQRLAADCFGAEQTFFLVGGSTVGNLALILTLCEQDDVMIVQRNVHKSVIHGLMLAGARAVFLPPRLDERTGQATGVTKDDLEHALCQYPEAKGVLLVNPNYYGMGTQLAPIIEAVHAHGKPILVDEAHGAHYGFHPGFPASAMACGADGSVQSTHKMLTAMTMGAMLHIQGNLLDRGRISRRLAMLQSSSPSYPIMASLDLARRQMALHGTSLLAQGLVAVHEFEHLLQRLPAFELAGERNLQTAGTTQAYETKDPFKVIVRASSRQISGYQLGRLLEQQGCFIEMADLHQVLLVFSLASTTEDAHRCFTVLQQISTDFDLSKQEQPDSFTNIYAYPQFAPMTDPVKFHLEHPHPQAERTVCLADAKDRLSAEVVIPYPPGIPILYEGEKITSETIDYLSALSRQGARIQGAKDPTLQTIRVFEPLPDSHGQA